MYIPAWLLVIAIAAVAFYYFRKHKTTTEPHPLIKKAMEKNNGNPTYDQMLKMSEEDHKKWLVLRVETDREKLLSEMIAHEKRTGSLRKTAKKEISGAEQMVLDVFDIDKSARIVRTLGNVKNVLSDSGEKAEDLVKHAIFAKAASDYVGLGNKMERDRSAAR